MTNPAFDPVTCDIYCRVIDNFGDISVCWRLARALAKEAGWQVRLVCDDLATFARLCPRFQSLPFSEHGVELFAWVVPPTTAADIIIEAFACDLPVSTVQAMQQRALPPLWINLEYLSAEDWVESCHGLPSPQPGGLNKIFVFPGFTERTGGLIREQGLLEAQMTWQADAHRREQFLRSLGVGEPQALNIVLFTYPTLALDSWLASWEHYPTRVNVLVPPGAVQELLRARQLPPAVQFIALPFIEPTAFDQLLWSSDCLLVRGEDSFVRAQWAAKPMIWHIYPQAEQAHEAKLQAFHQRYTASMPLQPRLAWEAFSWVWNRGQDVSTLWPEWLKHREALESHAQVWQQSLGQKANLQSCLQRLWQDHAGKL
jgi:uncharacterized repeat protein (TIGR03837 family)